jgi:transcription initiation factor TFIID subunit TAF12
MNNLIKSTGDHGLPHINRPPTARMNSEHLLPRLHALLVQRLTANARMDEMGQRLLIEYTQELSKTLLEHALLVAKHRDSAKVEAADIAFILEKRLDVVVPGLSEKHQFYKSISRLQEKRGVKRKAGV